MGSTAHQHRRVVTLEALNRASVRIEDESLGDFVRALREQHAQDDIVRRPRRIFGQQLFDEPRQAVNDLVDEAKMERVMHRFAAEARTTYGPRRRAHAGSC